MEPSSAVAGVPLAAVVRGASFNLAITSSLENSSVSVRDTFRAWLGGTELAGVTWVDTATLRTTVPALAPGSYDLVVEDPAGQRGTLQNALTVWPVALGPTELVFGTAPQTLVAAICSEITTVEVHLVDDGPVAVATDTTVALSASPTATALTFFVDDTCAASTDAVVIPAGATGAAFYFSGAEPGNVTATAVISGLSPATQEETITACGPESCADGCCDGRQCLASTTAHCGTAGGACVVCDLQTPTADGCSAGECRCGAGAACPADRQCQTGQCVCLQSPCCDPLSCPDGCCSGAACVHANAWPTCGLAGAACTTCDAVASDSCSSGGQCQCGGGVTCDAASECLGGGCRPVCAADMARVNQTNVCIDRYRGDPRSIAAADGLDGGR